MTKGKRKLESKEQARKKFIKFLGRDMTEGERHTFQAAFGMGWQEGKKRQRQITRKGEKEKNK